MKMKNSKLLVLLFSFVFLISTAIVNPVVSAVNGTQLSEADIKSTSDEDYQSFLDTRQMQNYEGGNITVAAADGSFSADSGVVIKEYSGKQSVAVWDSQQGSAVFEIVAPQTGLYQIGLEYNAIDSSENDIDFSLLINGKTPFAEAEELSVERIWKNETEVKTLNTGDQISPVQVQADIWYFTWLHDLNGVYNEPLTFLLEEGVNTVTIVLNSGTLAISEIRAGAVDDAPAYAEYKKANQSEIYGGDPVIIYGKDALYKTGKELLPVSDSTDPSLYPSSAVNQQINYIGGSSWQMAGSKLIWEFEAPADGYYALGFKYNQSYLPNTSSVRSLEIDGKTPYKELSEIAFDYGLTWQTMTFAEGDTPYLVYLKKGAHTLSMTARLGDYAKITRKLEGVVADLGGLYREIIMITGTYPDKNRDYRLSDQIPNLMERIEDYRNRLLECRDEIYNVVGKDGGSNAVILENMAEDLRLMLESQFTIQDYINNYFSNYCSVGAYVYDMRKMPLGLGSIILYNPQDSLKDFSANFFQKAVFSVQRFLVSFFKDYTSIYESGEDGKKITVWVNCGRDQAQVINELIRSDFTSKSGISVNLRISTTSVVQGELAGIAPDVALTQARSTPVSLALRGALYDLQSFDDFDKVITRFMTNATLPYQYKGGTYGLPDTQTFQVMFCRDDVLSELGVQPPDTWDELLDVASAVMRNNMMIGLPYTQVTDSGMINMGIGALNLYPTLLAQRGVTLYNDDLTATNLSTAEAQNAFNLFVSFYKDYRFPISYDFFNRFRTGEMPLAIGSYTLVSQISAAAPEIQGLWSMHTVPGTKNNDGTINRTIADSGTACIIMGSTESPKEAWEFLKWWTSDKVQSAYASRIESVLGVAGRYATANVNALMSLSWKKDVAVTISEQWKYVVPVAEVPGGYFTQRAIDNAFWLAYNENEVPNDVLSKWTYMANQEITHKYSEYEE